MAANLQLQLQREVPGFDWFSWALDESCHVRDTAQLLVFVCGITKDFQFTEELAAVRSMKGTTAGSQVFTELRACMDTLGLGQTGWGHNTWLSQYDGTNVGLLKQMQDKVTEMDPEQKLLFLHCIVHQQVLSKSVLKMKRVVDVEPKIVSPSGQEQRLSDSWLPSWRSMRLNISTAATTQLSGGSAWAKS